jgi:hypothetical protein
MTLEDRQGKQQVEQHTSRGSENRGGGHAATGNQVAQVQSETKDKLKDLLAKKS